MRVCTRPAAPIQPHRPVLLAVHRRRRQRHRLQHAHARARRGMPHARPLGLPVRFFLSAGPAAPITVRVRVLWASSRRDPPAESVSVHKPEVKFFRICGLDPAKSSAPQDFACLAGVSALLFCVSDVIPAWAVSLSRSELLKQASSGFRLRRCRRAWLWSTRLRLEA